MSFTSWILAAIRRTLASVGLTEQADRWAEVQAALKGRHKVTYSTVQTILRILEAKGYVGHDKEGRAFVFRPIVDERQARRRALRHILARLFDNSPSLLVLNVLEDERMDARELERLKELIRDA